MKLLIALLFISFISQGKGEFIKFAAGSEQIFSSDQGYDDQYVVTFSGVFENIPQIIFTDTLQTISRDTLSNQHIEFSFTLINVTTSVKIESPMHNPSTFAQFEWTAIDDQRIEVINVFNLINVGSQSFEFPHKNKNVLQGFITLTSFGFKDAITIDLQIETITTDSVIVNLTTSNTNLLSLGYQIVLGTTSAFIQSTIEQFKASNLVEFFSRDRLAKYVSPVSGLSYPNFSIYQEDFKSLDSNSLLPNEKFIWDVFYQNLKISQIMINMPITQKFIPFLNAKMRVTKKKNQSSDVMKLTILELNEEFTNPQQKIINVDKQIQELNIIVSFKCQDGQKIQGKVLKCLECDDQYMDIKENCNGGTDQINLNLKFKQQDQVYQQLKVKSSKNGFEITQPIINQVMEQYVIGQFYI